MDLGDGWSYAATRTIDDLRTTGSDSVWLAARQRWRDGARRRNALTTDAYIDDAFRAGAGGAGVRERIL